MIFQLRRSDHITDLLASLHWPRVPERIQFKGVFTHTLRCALLRVAARCCARIAAQCSLCGTSYSCTALCFAAGHIHQQRDLL